MTLAGSTGESELVPNATEERYVVRAQPRDSKEQGEAARPPPDQVEEEAPLENGTGDAPSVRVAPEDIPSFSEWTQQQLAERRRADPNVTERVRSSKVRSKNYASPDCGAKIVAANPEAVSASSVLTSSRDEYMLNHCTARIWFIVELCEAVQAKQLDLANFELFSSSPREFSVYLGSRFPSRDWRFVGRFTAQDSRDIQTFTLSPYLFGKFLKIEVHSHYGKEHYCPLSWVRVYGTSEYDVLATEDERHGDDDDDLAEEEAGDAPRNLFSSATDAVLSIVKKATAPFLKGEERQETTRVAPSVCVSPRYLTVCNNCSQHTYDNLFYLLSCEQNALYQLVTTPYVRWTLVQTDVCSRYGLDFVSLRKGAPFPLPRVPQSDSYLTALLKEPYLVALCNVLAVIENRVVVNMSLSAAPLNLTEDPSPSPPPISLLPSSSTCDAPDYSTSIHERPQRDFTDQIKPTKTMREEEVKNLLVIDHSLAHTESLTDNLATSLPNSATRSTAASSLKDTPSSQENGPVKVSFVDKGLEESGEGRESREPDASLDAILQDLSELERVVNQQPASATPPPGPPKDSIFLRLANRIKNLELNMSLSSSYLEELSRRYRIQLEALGQTVNVTATRLEEQVRLEELRTRRREEEMVALRAQLAAATRDLKLLMEDRNSWVPRPLAVFWFLVELFAIWYFITRWVVPPVVDRVVERGPAPVQGRGPRRRNSVESLPGHVPPPRPVERRPSDEALEIALTTNYSTAERKRKKKRKDSSRKTSAVAVKRKKSSDLPNCIEHEAPMEITPLLRQSSEPPPALEVDVPVLGADVLTSNRFAAFASPPAPRPPALVRRFSSPGFMRTAMSTRAARSSESFGHEQTRSDPNQRLKKESGFKKYMRKLF